MPSLPRKSVKGTMFKKWVVDSIDQIIDYLSGNWLQPGNGINIRRTPSGTIIELQKQAETRQTLSGGGGANQDITSTVAGGTAFVGLTGSTASAAFVGTGNVTISGNTNGEIEIGGGGGIPFSGVSTTSIRLDSGYHVYTHAGWARMSCEIQSYGAGAADYGRAYLRVIQSGVTTDHLVIENGIDSIEATIGGSLMIPVVSGSTVQAYIDMTANYSIDYSLLPNEILIYD
jgi:hypothetical protein